ncbi:MAG: amino terminal protease family protein [Chitinophagaceae bacterium]|nr:amino terminal protease family protein [Chitinophagaceae bacterium]
MTIFRNIFLLIIVTSIIACSHTNTKKDDTNSTLLQHTIEISPEHTAIAFLNWYKQNEDSLNKIKIITGGLQDTTTFYSIDFKESEKYLSELKKSGYLSNQFLNNLRTFFKISNERFKEHPQNDGPAEGFEADLIMKAQDYSEVWESLDHVKVIAKKIDGNKAFIKLLFTGNYKTNYYLTQNGNKWLIDRIDNDFSGN